MPAPATGPRLIEAYDDEIVYDITIELPDAGLIPADYEEIMEPLPMAPDDTAPASTRRYPTRTRRSVVGNQPYDTYAPRIQLL